MSVAEWRELLESAERVFVSHRGRQGVLRAMGERLAYVLFEGADRLSDVDPAALVLVSTKAVSAA